MGRNESEADGLSRRELLAAAGGAAGVAVLGGTLLGAPAAGAAPGSSAPGESEVPGQAVTGAIAASLPSSVTPGFDYLMLSYADFSAREAGATRVYNGGGDFSVSGGIILAGGIHLPLGAVVKELEAYTTNGANSIQGFLARYPASGSFNESINFTVPANSGTVTTTTAVDYTAVATESVAMVLNMGNSTNTTRGMRIGYLPRSKVKLVAPVRVWDSRNPGGAPGDGPAPPPGAAQGPFDAVTAITLTLGGYRGIPATISGLVFSLSVLAPTTGGFMRAYPGGSPAPLAIVGTFDAGEVVDLYPIVATGTVGANAGKLTVQVGMGTGVHVVLDVTGYIT